MMDSGPPKPVNDKAEVIPKSISAAMARCPNYLDFPTAWAIQKDRGDKLKHHPRCSSVPGWDPISGPGFLCDCGAVQKEYDRIRTLTQGADNG